MTYSVKSIESSDTVVLDSGDKYRAADSNGRSALFSVRVGDTVDVKGSGSDTTMKVFGKDAFKVKRV